MRGMVVGEGGRSSGVLLYVLYENRYSAACPVMQNAAVQEIFCTELNTCD